MLENRWKTWPFIWRITGIFSHSILFCFPPNKYLPYRQTMQDKLMQANLNYCLYWPPTSYRQKLVRNVLILLGFPQVWKGVVWGITDTYQFYGPQQHNNATLNLQKFKAESWDSVWRVCLLRLSRMKIMLSQNSKVDLVWKAVSVHCLLFDAPIKPYLSLRVFRRSVRIIIVTCVLNIEYEA